MNKKIRNILQKAKVRLMNLYDGDSSDLEFLFDTDIQRCKHAEIDHMKERRVYAHVGCERMMICVSSSIDLIPDENILGIIIHEIGHLIHLENPDIVSGMSILEDISDDEIIADFIIDQLFGIHIFYDDKKIQWVSFNQFTQVEEKIW